MAVGAVNISLHALVEGPGTSARSRALAAFFDLGQLLAAGLLLAALTGAWQRWRPTAERPLGWILATSGALLAGAWVLAPVMRGPALRAPAGWSTAGVAAALGAMLALSVPAACAIGEHLGRTRLRGLVVLVGLLIAAGNGLVLERLYPGLHVLAACLSAALIGSVLAVSNPPSWLPRGTASHRTASLLVLAVWAAWAWVARPPNDVAIRLFALPSAAFAPYAAAVRASLSPPSADLSAPLNDVAGRWYRDRRDLGDIPSTQSSLLPEDAIVIMLVVDAMRADLLTSDEHVAALPTMRKLRDEGTFFSRAWAPGPATASSVAAIFAGRPYSALRWDMKDFGKRKLVPADDPTPRFPERLSAAGIPTVEIATQRMLTNQWGLLRGFTEVRPWNRGWARANLVASRLVARLARHDEGPLFMHTHFMDPHSPYNLGGREGTAFDRYVREVALVDEAIGRVVQAIEDEGLTERTAIILTADHGEAFGEHNTRFHWSTLYEELVRVPLVLWIGAGPQRRIDTHVSLVDLGPTILDLFGQPTPSAFLGQSLLPLLRGTPDELSRPVVIESGRGMRAQIFDDGFKIIEDMERDVVELYDLERDPEELHNLYDVANPAHRMRLMHLHAFFNAHEYRAVGYERPIRP